MLLRANRDAYSLSTLVTSLMLAYPVILIDGMAHTVVEADEDVEVRLLELIISEVL